ncbi:MAG TPA: protein-glutamine glutaminase family protein [Ignavibacteria bacterium]
MFNLANSKLTFLDFDDCNNCPLRAHIMTFLFSKEYPELKMGKVWLFADSKLSSRRDHYKTHRKEYLSYKSMCPLWGFHVAPVLIFENDTLVIDPSTQSSPAKLSAWAGNISPRTASYVILKKNEYYSYPEDAYDLYDDNKVTWSVSKKFSLLGDEIDFLAQKLTMAYSKFFDPIKFYYYKSKLLSLLEKLH